MSNHSHEGEQGADRLGDLRHTLAHLLAAAVVELYPDAKRTIGPAIDDGFYFDFDFPTEKPREEDLPRIEEAMRRILPTWTSMVGEEVTPEEAKRRYAGNEYKHELIDEFAGEGKVLTFYRSGSYEDLCKGGHLENPAQEIPEDCFALTRLAGAYWRGDEKRPMLTRIYAHAFATKADLDLYRLSLEEAKRRDHRAIGEKMDLFHFDESIGKGLPLWLPKGNVIKEELEAWAKETEAAWGYDRVTTPIITKEDLFHTSGHLPLYEDSMYAPIVIEEERYFIKPMNCPFHHKAYAARPKSYRDLPMRIAEYGWCHRYEDSGSLFGLMRVRGMQMNDAHIYVQKEKAVEEFVQVIKLHEHYYKALGITDYEMELALRDPAKMDKYHGDEADWEDAERMTTEAMKLSGVPFRIAHEGAAFYGPKMDFQIRSSIGRAFTASTNQLDLYMGKRFGLEYTDRDGVRKTPAIIHRAPLGTHERFIGFLIEHFAGDFPLWLSPVQVVVVPVKETHDAHAASVRDALRKAGLRADFSPADGPLGKRIHEAKATRAPYVLVVGEAEMLANAATVEHRTRGKLGAFPLGEIIEKLSAERTTRALESAFA